MEKYYYDAHCHLNDEKLSVDWLNHANLFFLHGGRGIVTVGCDIAGSLAACDISRGIIAKIPGMWATATAGIHPYEACVSVVHDENIDEVMKNLADLSRKNADVIVAIGECGIDMHYEHSVATLAAQQEVLRRQCLLARDLGLPVVIHSRDGYQETIEVLKEFPDVVYYFHCFGYGAEELGELLRLFPRIYFGFDGNITYPKAENLRDACRKVP
jgi:TatD DNase family protein